MKTLTRICALSIALAWAHGALASDIPEDMPDIEKARFCERVRELAIQALYDRDRGAPMKLYAEDGGYSPRIANALIRRIYEDREIATPTEAQRFARTRCNQMMGTKEIGTRDAE